MHMDRQQKAIANVLLDIVAVVDVTGGLSCRTGGRRHSRLS